MLIGQATLKSAAFCSRLSLLVEDLKAAGCVVWLEGMSVRFDLPDAQQAASPPGALDALLRRYDDVVTWIPEAKAEEAVTAFPETQPRAVLRWNPLGKRRQSEARR